MGEAEIISGVLCYCYSSSICTTHSGKYANMSSFSTCEIYILCKTLITKVNNSFKLFFLCQPRRQPALVQLQLYLSTTLSTYVRLSHILKPLRNILIDYTHNFNQMLQRSTDIQITSNIQ